MMPENAKKLACEVRKTNYRSEENNKKSRHFIHIPHHFLFHRQPIYFTLSQNNTDMPDIRPALSEAACRHT